VDETLTRLEIPPDDNRERAVCSGCGTIHYANPKVVAGCLPIWNNQVLLCKRAIEPRKGYWTLPAGFLENGETIEAGAHRETWEEAEAKVENSACSIKQMWLRENTGSVLKVSTPNFLTRQKSPGMNWHFQLSQTRLRIISKIASRAISFQCTTASSIFDVELPKTSWFLGRR